jgi:predicted TPR repeat methyltransferase
VVSEDAGHPEIRRDDIVIPADPLVVQNVSEMVHDAAERVARLAVVAARQATFDAAATMADRAAELSPNDPEAAEELYLQTLGEGWDGGQAVRSFFLARYGMPADEVLTNLNHVLGRRPPPPGATSTADLALFYPRP